MELPMSCNRMKFSCVFLLLFLFNSYCFAQEKDSSAGTGNVVDLTDSINSEYVTTGDTSVIQMDIDHGGDSILKWKQSREFSYMAYLDSLLRKKKSELKVDTFDLNKNNGKTKKKNASANFSTSNTFLNSFPVKIFFWVVAIFFIGFILYKLFIKGGLFDREAEEYKSEQASQEPEKLSEYSEYNDLIHSAESNNDFNQAVRYLYLQSLKKLSDQELIFFSPYKTNYNYIRELSGKIYQKDFSFLTHNYEYVWYGKFFIDNNRYQQLKAQFISFNKKV